MAFNNLWDVVSWSPIGGHDLARKLTGENQKTTTPVTPQIPTITTAATSATATAKKRRVSASRSESIYTSPLGLGGQADVNRKTLLGS
jgi:hypothetical protein